MVGRVARRTLWAIIAAGLALVACAGRGAAPDDDSAASDESPFTITWAGDTLLADAAQPYLDQHGYEWPFEHVAPLLEDSVVIINAEGPVTIIEEKWDPDQRWSYNAQPEAAAALAAVGVWAAGLSNNHALDRGPQGLDDTLAHLSEAGVRPFGAGLDQAQAEAPLLIDTPAGKVGVVALSLSWGAERTAGEGQAGTVVLSEESIRRGYTLASQAGAEHIVGYVHWGRNYAEVRADQRAWAAAFAAAGYDLVIGHGAHVQQPIELIDGMPVVYSLGNFVFGTPGRFDEEFPGYGLIAVTPLGPDGFDTLILYCILTNNRVVDFQPRLCPPDEAARVLRALHPAVRVERGVGILRW